MNIFDEIEKENTTEESEPKEPDPPAIDPHYQHCPYHGGCPALSVSHAIALMQQAASIHIRVGDEVFQNLLALLFVVHEVEPLAVMAFFDVILGVQEIALIAVPVAIAAGLAGLLQRNLPALTEPFENFVLEGQEELATAGIALAGGPTDHLAIDASGLMGSVPMTCSPPAWTTASLLTPVPS